MKIHHILPKNLCLLLVMYEERSDTLPKNKNLLSSKELLQCMSMVPWTSVFLKMYLTLKVIQI